MNCPTSVKNTNLNKTLKIEQNHSFQNNDNGMLTRKNDQEGPKNVYK